MHIHLKENNDQDRVKKCSLPDGLDIKPDGEHSIDPCTYETKEIHKNVTVIVSQCANCGHIDISWVSQENSEHEIISELEEITDEGTH